MPARSCQNARSELSALLHARVATAIEAHHISSTQGRGRLRGQAGQRGGRCGRGRGLCVLLRRRRRRPRGHRGDACAALPARARAVRKDEVRAGRRGAVDDRCFQVRPTWISAWHSR